MGSVPILVLVLALALPLTLCVNIPLAAHLDYR